MRPRKFFLALFLVFLCNLGVCLGAFDKDTRKTFWKNLRASIRKPLELFRTLHLQTFVVMQSVDILPDDEGDTCNGCSQLTTNIEREETRGTLEGYVPTGARRGAGASVRDGTQMQWPGNSKSVWNNQELQRIGLEIVEDSGLLSLKN